MFNQWFKTDIFRPKKLHLRFYRRFLRWEGGNFWAEKYSLTQCSLNKASWATIEHPKMNDEPTVYMPERYFFSALDGSDFSIELRQDRRFEIKRNYEPDYRIYSDSPCEMLTMEITRNSELEFSLL
jgi:hypothetical protein